MIDAIIGAKFLCFCELGIIAPGSDDPAAKHFCNLYCRGADAASCTKDQHLFRWPQPRAREQHVPSGLENERNCRGLFEG